MYWDINKTLSHNCLFNFIVGNRGGGKTYGFKDWAIKDYLKTGSQFVYVRRYDTELKTTDKFFEDIKVAYPTHEFNVKSGKSQMFFYIDGKIAGYGIPLSKAKIFKSVAFPRVNKIGFDEFIIDKGVYHYLHDEVVCFLELYETIARMRENVRAFFLANSVSMYNPYFLYFDITLPYGTNFKKANDVLIELVADTEFIEAKSQTRFAKMLKDTDYYAYSVENKFLRDNNDFIAKKTGQCIDLFEFIWQGTTYTVWESREDYAFFIEISKGRQKVIKYALSKADHSVDTNMIKNFKTLAAFRALLAAMERGCCYYENQQTKKACNEVLLATYR